MEEQLLRRRVMALQLVVLVQIAALLFITSIAYQTHSTARRAVATLGECVRHAERVVATAEDVVAGGAATVSMRKAVRLWCARRPMPIYITPTDSRLAMATPPESSIEVVEITEEEWMQLVSGEMTPELEQRLEGVQ